MDGSSIGPSSEVRVSLMYILPVVNSQCSETNVMQFLFNLVRIKGLYMFRALLAHPQEALHDVNWLQEDLSSTSIFVQPTDI
jgi:hypothetical protein